MHESFFLVALIIIIVTVYYTSHDYGVINRELASRSGPRTHSFLITVLNLDGVVPRGIDSRKLFLSNFIDSF